MTSPPARLIRAPNWALVSPDRRKRTDPSPNTTLPPPERKAKTSLSLVQYDEPENGAGVIPSKSPPAAMPPPRGAPPVVALDFGGAAPPPPPCVAGPLASPPS